MTRILWGLAGKGSEIAVKGVYIRIRTGEFSERVQVSLIFELVLAFETPIRDILGLCKKDVCVTILRFGILLLAIFAILICGSLRNSVY